MTQKIKIIHVVKSLEVGGLENGVVNLANSIDKTAFDIVLCCIKREGLLRERLDGPIRVRCLHEREGFNPYRIFLLARFFSAEKPHIVHMHGWGSDLFSGVLGARLAGVPIVINGEHGALYLGHSRRVIAQKLLYKLIDYVVPVSHSLKKAVVKEWSVPVEKILPIINGVDINKYKPDRLACDLKRGEFGFGKDDLVVGSVGRLEKVKDYGTYLNAAREVIASHPRVQFVLVGDGQEKTMLTGMAASLGISRRVHFLGSRSDIPELMNMIDIFVLTSIREGLSNTILEAMACGKPIIATRVGDNETLIEDKVSGYLTNVADVRSIVNHIERLIDNDGLRKQMGDAGLRRIKDKFQLSVMISAYEQLYKRVYDEKRSN